MNENKQHTRLVTLVYVAILAAAHVVLSNVGSIPMGPYRVSLKSVATIMAGLWFGPVAGALCGADRSGEARAGRPSPGVDGMDMRLRMVVWMGCAGWTGPLPGTGPPFVWIKNLSM